FLGKFYDDISEWSFQTEMFFLCNRYKQLVDIEKKYINAGKPVIADYHIAKNMIFAKRTLEADQLSKYEQIYDILTKGMPLPNMMIYLTGSLDTSLKRIEKRGREIEQNIMPAYLEQLSADYEHYMNAFEENHPDIPVIRINGDELDFIHCQNDLDKIINIVSNHLNPSPEQPMIKR